MKKNKVVFLCTGNICRSPIGEALLKHAIKALDEKNPLKKLEVISAGTSTVEGMPASENSVAVLKNVGVELKNHKSRMLTKKILDEAFAIFAMDEGHIHTAMSLFDNALPQHVHCVLAMDPHCKFINVPDPYGGGIEFYEEVRDEIASAIPHIIKFLEKEYK